MMAQIALQSSESIPQDHAQRGSQQDAHGRAPDDALLALLYCKEAHRTTCSVAQLGRKLTRVRMIVFDIGSDMDNLRGFLWAVAGVLGVLSCKGFARVHVQLSWQYYCNLLSPCRGCCLPLGLHACPFGLRVPCEDGSQASRHPGHSYSHAISGQTQSRCCAMEHYRCWRPKVHSGPDAGQNSCKLCRVSGEVLRSASPASDGAGSA